jgi:hypothetical protein
MKSDLDSLIEELQAGIWLAPRAPRSAQVEEATWPLGSLDAERRFGQSHAKLFPFIGRKVRTPVGSGVLLQVFAARVTVLLDAEFDRCSFFRPTEIEPASWEVS